MSGFPKVSVVIPAYSCAGTLADVLRHLLNQTIQPLQIIVVNDGSPDDLDSVIVPFLDRIEYVHNPQTLGLARSCNVGLRRAIAPYVMTVHSDCLLDPDYIERLLTHLDADPGVAAVTGQYLFDDYDSLTLSNRVFTALNLIPVERDRSDTGVYALDFIEGKADIFRRDVIEKYGFFEENLLLTGEDQDLSAKIRRDGYRIVQDCRARFRVMFTGTSDSLRKVLRKQYTYAVGQAFVVVKHGRGAFAQTVRNRRLRARHRLGQLIFVGGLILLTAAVLMRFSLWPLLVLWIGLRFGYYFVLGLRKAPRDVILVTLLGPVADLCYFAGGVAGALKTALGLAFKAR